MGDAKAYGKANEAIFEQSEAAKSEAKVEKILYIVASSDRGLCGGIHSSVGKAARKDIEEGEGAGKDIRVVALGEKPKQQMTRGDGAKALMLSFSQIGKSVPTFNDALAIADKIEAEGFKYDKVSLCPPRPRPSCFSAVGPAAAGGQSYAKRIAKNPAAGTRNLTPPRSQVKVIYNKFLTVISYEASALEIYSTKALEEAPAFAAYEVESEELAGDLSSFALANAIYAGLVEGYAAEISARRNAMENASKNAVSCRPAPTVWPNPRSDEETSLD